MYVDQHSYSNQEIGYEDGVPHKGDALHQRRPGGDETVQDESGIEGPQYGLKPDHAGQRRGHEHEGQDEYELHHRIAGLTEEPAGDPGEAPPYPESVDTHLHEQQKQTEHIEMPRHPDLHNLGQRKQSQKHRHDSAADGNDDTSVVAEAEAAYDGIGYQGM